MQFGISIKGTIFENLSKEVDTQTFMREFMKKKRIKFIDDWTWENIAWKISTLNQSTKADVIKYYNKRTNGK